MYDLDMAVAAQRQVRGMGATQPRCVKEHVPIFETASPPPLHLFGRWPWSCRLLPQSRGWAAGWRHPLILLPLLLLLLLLLLQVALELQAIAAEQGLGCWVAASATLNSRRFKLAGTSKQLVRAGEALV